MDHDSQCQAFGHCGEDINTLFDSLQKFLYGLGMGGDADSVGLVTIMIAQGDRSAASLGNIFGEATSQRKIFITYDGEV